jgi:hypothetical protein
VLLGLNAILIHKEVGDLLQVTDAVMEADV